MLKSQTDILNKNKTFFFFLKHRFLTFSRTMFTIRLNYFLKSRNFNDTNSQLWYHNVKISNSDVSRVTIILLLDAFSHFIITCYHPPCDIHYALTIFRLNGTKTK